MAALRILLSFFIGRLKISIILIIIFFTKGPFTISPDSTKISLRAKGRQMAFKLESSEIGDSWLLGDMRINTREDGLR